MSILKSFSFNCNEISLIEGDTFAYIEGGGITLWNVASGEKEYISSDRDGFCKLKTNHKYDLIAAAEYGIDPKIIVYEYSTQNPIYSFDNPGQLDVLDLQISRNGKRLIAVFGCPTYEIKCWNLETGESFDLKSFTVNAKEYKGIHFNPDDHNSFIILNKYSVVYGELKPCWDVTEEEEPIKRYYIESRTFQNSGENVGCENIGCIWDSKKRLYVAMDAHDTHNSVGKVMVYNMDKINSGNLPAAHESAINETRVKDYYYKKENPFAPKAVVEDSGPVLPGYEVLLDSIPTAMVLTQKHLIVAKDNFALEWMLLEAEDNEKKLTLEKEFPLDERCNNKIIHLIYNQTFEAIYIVTEGGDMLKLPEKAETNLEEDEGDEVDADKAAEDGEKNQEKEFEAEIEDVAVSHSKSVSCLKEIPNSSYFITTGLDGKICLWEAETSKLKSQYVSESDITCADVSPDGKVLLVGTTKSCIKIFDLCNRNQIRLVGSKRLFKKDKPILEIRYSPDGSLVGVSSNSKRLFFLYGTVMKDFKIVGKIKLQFEITSFVWSNSKKMPNERLGVVAVTQEGLLYAMNSPPTTESWENKDLTLEMVSLHIRRIDFGATKLCVLDSGDVIITGKDRNLKRYRIPDENVLRGADLKSKIPGNPQDDAQGLDLPCNVFFYSKELNKLVLGGQDGTISLRSAEKLDDLGTQTSFKAHNYRDNGVSSAFVSKNGKFIYTAGNEGSIFLWSLEGEEFPSVDNVDDIEDEELQALEEIQEDEWDEDIPHYTRVIEEEEYRAQEDQRIQIQRELNEELDNIKNALRKLLDENEYADELEKLRRDEFVIDLKGRDNIRQKGEQEREKLKQLAYKENLRNEILFNRIKETTWDSMEVQLKGLIGLKSNHIVHNFQIRKITPEEKRKLKIALEIRKMEIKEKAHRDEKKLPETFKIETFCKKPDTYIVNGLPGYKPLVLVDYEAKEDIPQPKTNLDEDVKAKRQGKDNARGKYGANKGKDIRPKAQTVTKKVVEEEVKEDQKPQEDKELKERQENPAWDNLYGAFDLVTNNRKRTQIIILKDLIFRIKEKFNKEFEELCNARQSQCELINEKNNRIKEIQENLQTMPEVFKPTVNIFEQPQRVLTVEPSEIPFERHLTREEKAQLEEERRKEEERLRLLQSDDAGVRAVSQMMNGTIEEKKETPLTETLIREDWMSMNPDDMNEDQRMRLREFEAKDAKLKEEKEKIRKSLESELKKLKNDINEICSKFDDRLFMLFRRRLEFEYRIFEQELYIIRLTLSMLMEQQNKAKAYNLQILLKELYDKNKQLKMQREELDRTKAVIDEEKERREMNYRDAIDKKFNRLMLLYPQIFPETEDKKKADEGYLKDPKYQRILCKLDPFYETDKAEVKVIHQEVFENYLPEIEKKLKDDDEGDKEKSKGLFLKKFEAKKALEIYKKEQNDIQAYIYSLEKSQLSTEEEMKKKFIKSLIIRERLAKAISNIEIQIRFNQGQVELQHDDPIPRLADAILIRKSLIDNQNAKIQEKGNEKIEKKKEITETNYKVADLKYKIELCKLEIRDIEAKTNEVKRLKVKKEMQAALSKKDPQLSQAELAKLNNQIAKIKDTTDKRILIYLKKEEKVKREKEYLIRENKQLNEQGHALRDTVNQRKAIAQMMDEKNETNIAAQNDGNKKTKVGDLKIDPESDRKFKEVSQNKRLFELAKRQTEEIELLREELNRLKAKTFANFTNQVNRF